MGLKDQILFRIKFVIFIAGFLCILVIVQMFRVQWLERSTWKAKLHERTIRESSVYADRGNILSSDYRILASSVPHYYMRIDFQTPKFNRELYLKNLDSLAICLSKYYGNMSVNGYKSHLRKGLNSKSRGFALVHFPVDYIQLEATKKFPFIRENRRYTGFQTHDVKIEREKPFGTLARRTLGELEPDGKTGSFGLESSYNEELSGKNGLVEKQKIGGVYVARSLKKPVQGYDLVTTIDVTLQDVAESSLRQQLEEYAADYGCAVLMDIRNGDIMAMANLTKTNRGYQEMVNYAVSDKANPGSTFKLVSFVTAAEDELLDINRTTNTGNGSYPYKGEYLRDSHGLGTISYADVFIKSSNIGTSLMIDSLYGKNPNRFTDHLLEMGLNEPTGIDLIGEPDPYIPIKGETRWSGITLPWMAMGYAAEFTPLQMLNFYAAIANDGKMMKPRLVKALYQGGDLVKEYKPEVRKSRICSQHTIETIKPLMERVVEEGTASNLNSAHLKIAGKTGTAQMYRSGEGGYREGKRTYKASFCGYFPAEDPQYACMVVVTNPTRGSYYGNRVAGPVFRSIADKLYSMRPELAQNEQEPKDTIPPAFTVPVSLDGHLAELRNVYDFLDVNYSLKNDTAQWVRTSTQNHNIEIQPMAYRRSMVPNVVGMGAMDAVYMLESSGLKVTIKGTGRVKQQSLRPGARFKPGNQISITLG